MRFTGGFMRVSPSGRWVGVVKYRDPMGQWRQLTKTFSADRAESELSFARWRAGLASSSTVGAGNAPVPGRDPGGTPVAGSWPGAAGPTVEQEVRACLAAQLARGRIERSTHDTQLAYAERELFGELGTVPLAALTSALAQSWVDRVCLRLAPGSARIVYSVLRKACVRAVAHGGLARDPLAAVEPPPRARPARVWLSDASVELLKCAATRDWGATDGRSCAVALALHAGLRIGECCALRWRDVDLASGRLRVAASVGRSRGGCYLKAPKCAASAREVPIVSPLARTLEGRASGETPPDPAHFVCGGERFLSPGTLSNAYSRLCGRAGVTDSDGRRATFHVLRHTFATRAVRAGVDVRTLADLMGHARADVTLNVYAASGEDALRAAAGRLEAAFGGGSGRGGLGGYAASAGACGETQGS